jgi:hypothetical protein
MSTNKELLVIINGEHKITLCKLLVLNLFKFENLKRFQIVEVKLK